MKQSFDVSFDLRQNKQLSKQSWGWWFETPSGPLWRHCNGVYPYIMIWIRSSQILAHCEWNHQSPPHSGPVMQRSFYVFVVVMCVATIECHCNDENANDTLYLLQHYTDVTWMPCRLGNGSIKCEGIHTQRPSNAESSSTSWLWYHSPTPSLRPWTTCRKSCLSPVTHITTIYSTWRAWRRNKWIPSGSPPGVNTMADIAQATVSNAFSSKYHCVWFKFIAISS